MALWSTRREIRDGYFGGLSQGSDIVWYIAHPRVGIGRHARKVVDPCPCRRSDPMVWVVAAVKKMEKPDWMKLGWSVT